jgi:hypothetical protein
MSDYFTNSLNLYFLICRINLYRTDFTACFLDWHVACLPVVALLLFSTTLKEIPMIKTIGLLATIAFGTMTTATQASTIPYPDIGTTAPASVFTATATGDITAYFYATDAGYDSEIGMLVNGVSTGVYGLWNHGSAHGDSIVLGSVTAGDSIEFVLKVLTTSSSWYSVAADNSDGKNHTYATAFGGDAWIPVGTYVAFEDLPYLGDVDYNDHQFVFTNVSNHVPEPAGIALFGLGLLALSFARKRAA